MDMTIKILNTVGRRLLPNRYKKNNKELQDKLSSSFLSSITSQRA